MSEVAKHSSQLIFSDAGLHFPNPTHRLIIADAAEPFTCLATDDNGLILRGLCFDGGKYQLDIYSNGKNESDNPTSLSDIAQALAKATDVRLRPFIS